jgi:putative N6-adenine-specific DNA methylase
LKLIAKTFAGLEEVLAAEIRNLGGMNVELLKRGVSYEGDKRLLYRSNWELRTALRILMPIHQFQTNNEHDFYNKIREIDWARYMDVKQTLAVDAVVNSTYFTHSQYVALKTKDAVVDQFRDKTMKRPSVNSLTPDLLINIHINGDQVNVSLDASGDSLHRRGYRVDAMEAPINEVLAAGMIQLTPWRGETPFADAMCGSGTILAEAAMLAQNIAPQHGRDYFSFKRWLDYDAALLREVVEANAKKALAHPIYGSDLSFQAIRVTERNLEAAGVKGTVEMKRKDFFKAEKPAESGVLMFNPPYDERLHVGDVEAFYQQIGDTLKKQWTGWTAWMISSNPDAVKRIGLRPSNRIPLFNGALECRLLRFEMY